MGWWWTSTPKKVPAGGLRFSGDYFLDAGFFKLNLRKAVIAAFLYDVGNRNDIGDSYVKNVAANAYRAFYSLDPTAAFKAMDNAWFQSTPDYHPWLQEAQVIFLRNDQAEWFSYLRP